MKKLITLLSVAFFSINLSAQDDGFGIGVMVGQPTGLNAKYWLQSKTAADFGLAYSMGGAGYLHLHADVLMHGFNIVHVSEGRLPLYIGLGARLLLADDPQLGIRIPLGADYMFQSAPFDVFFEFVPILDLVPGTSFDWNVDIGLRYFFD